jgi:hypothetical protein
VKHYPKSSNKSTTSKSKTTESVITTITMTDTAITPTLSDSEIKERLQVYRPEFREIMKNEITKRMEDRRLQIENERKRN